MTTDESIQNLCYEYPKDGKIEPYIFISYSHDDSELIYPIIKRLHADGYRVWFDAALSHKWKRELVKHIKNAAQFIVFLSSNSITSKFVYREIDCAVNELSDDDIFPVLCDMDIEEIAEDIKFSLSPCQHERLDDYDKLKKDLGSICLQPQTNFSTSQQEEDNIKKIIDRLKAIPERTDEATDNDDHMDSITAELYKRAHEDDAEAQFNLGWRYFNGKGVRRNLQQAVHWYTESARQGYAPAQFNLGLCYEKSADITRDWQEVEDWQRRKASNQEIIVSQCTRRYVDREYALQTANAAGDGEEQRILDARYKNIKQAVYWYTKSAKQGYAAAQCKLAVCYENGTGVAKDLQQAIYWYTEAAKQGNDEAKEKLKELGIKI